MRVICLALAALFLAHAAFAQAVKEKVVPLNGQWNESGTTFTLDWQDATPLRVGPVDINRRPLGATGGQSWEPVLQGENRRFFFEDLTPLRGQAYEYQVIRKARDVVDVGYWLAGWEVPARATRGVALLVIDETVAKPLSARIDRFERDLLGDGWQVTRHLVPRDAPETREENLATGRALRRWITAEVEKTRDTPHSLILLGRVPVMESGRVAPDGHQPEPHATDLFYADIGRLWPEGEVGKLRPSTLPDLQIDMTVGRIDFASITGGDLQEELRLLARYLDKNHHWRHGRLGDLRNAYGQNGMLEVEQAALRNIVGPDAITDGGHHDAGLTQPYLWGVDFGDWKGENYKGAGIKPIFAINFGSHKQKFKRGNNPITWLLAQDWYPLAVGWGGRPSWQLQHMALGGTIGDVHLRTVNNGPLVGGPYRDVLDYYPMGQYLWRGPIWVNLLGDPTLHAFPLAPPEGLSVAQDGQAVTLTWNAPQDGDITGYQVFRAGSATEVFEPISDVQPETRFTDQNALEGAVYMVRSYGLQQVYAGSFFTYSQGAFASLEGAPPARIDQVLTASVDTPLRISAQTDLIWSFIEGPTAGQLQQDAQGWLYTPPEGFTGVVTVRNAVSNAWGTTEGTTTITVGR